MREPSSARPILPHHKQACKEYPAERERTGAPRSERMHRQLTSSSHPPQQSLFDRHRTSPSSATEPAQLQCSNHNNGNLHQLHLAPGMSGCFPATHEFSPEVLLAAQPSLCLLQAAAEQLALGLRGGSGGAGRGGLGPAVLHIPPGRRGRDLHAIHQRLRQLLLCHSCKGHNKCLLLSTAAAQGDGISAAAELFPRGLVQKLSGILLSPSSCSETRAGECWKQAPAYQSEKGIREGCKHALLFLISGEGSKSHQTAATR